MNILHYKSLIYLSTFLLISSFDINTINLTSTGFYFISADSTELILEYPEQSKSLYLYPQPILTTEDFKSIELREENTQNLPWTHSILINLKKESSSKWNKATSTATTNNLIDIAFVLDNKIITVLGIFRPIDNGVIGIFGDHLTKEDLNLIIEKLNN